MKSVVAACLVLVGTGACGHKDGSGDAGTALPPGATSVTTVTAQPASTPVDPPPASSVAVRLQPVSFAPIARAADPSVVTIKTVGEEEQVSPFTHRRRRREVGGLGTGFVVDKNGIILTNNHVVAGADAITVRLADDRELQGKVVGTDPPTDIAVVRVDAKDLHPLALGDSDAVEVGDWVVAIGNPMGLAHTVSAGIVSAKGRTKEDVPLDPAGYYDFIQTDASINPGNSGGPLLDLKGEVVGINAAIRGDAQGIGFAIPINMVKQLLPMLERDGHVTRSALGVGIKDPRELSSDERDALKVKLSDKVAVIEEVVAGGPADRAGVQPGDLIVSFDGQPIDRSATLRWLASTTGVGRTVTLHVRRADKEFDLKVTLGQLPPPPVRSR